MSLMHDWSPFVFIATNMALLILPCYGALNPAMFAAPAPAPFPAPFMTPIPVVPKFPLGFSRTGCALTRGVGGFELMFESYLRPVRPPVINNIKYLLLLIFLIKHS